MSFRKYYARQFGKRREELYLMKSAWSLAHPKAMHSEGGYEFEKIHSMRADNYSSTYHGRQLAADFANVLACKWVNIDAQSMPVEESQLLANVACYLETQAVGKREW